MSTKKPSSVEEYKLENNFERLRAKLLQPAYGEILDKPLAYWALPNDRGLPLVFLGRHLEALLDTPFGQLLATPGVGHRKIASLVTLLNRAAAYKPSDDPESEIDADLDCDDEDGFQPANVSEALWVEWRNTVKRHGLMHVMLGRLAPSLQTLPTVIWNTPLSYYADRSLAEIRRMKTHGEKRVRAVLEVFSTVHNALSGVKVRPSLTVQLEPAFVRPLDRWITAVLEAGDAPQADEIREALARPLVDQIRLDIGPSVSQLAAGRLGIDGPPQSVRRQAQQLDLTRARVYQLLDDCTKVMRVRWPEGEWMLLALEQELRADSPAGPALEMVAGLIDLFYHRPGDASTNGAPQHRTRIPAVMAR